MNIALGFGSTETAFEERERVFVEDFLEKNKHKDDNLYNWYQFTDEVVVKLNQALKERKEEYDQ